MRNEITFQAASDELITRYGFAGHTASAYLNGYAHLRSGTPMKATINNAGLRLMPGYDRNPDVVAQVLLRAQGICEACAKPAPFRRSSNGTPYLEVHHIVQLAHGGDDSVDNAQALCPNCHREMHFGVQA
ncbi:HNH endonuclease [Pseudomonas gingeri]|uniref:HNH endonuclease n=1 Tax=Pseudomonas gingeri TaxID=117681 RepID=UPI0015A3D6AF|nr:HNH endonuclease signature motif containing protein [Pseudomonas gingeri]NWD06389.1 HNH endonuclease [Pseudomonas gingeri]NWD49416.1 HNH endonuclease [Pseudomonas gingeri]NWE32773.1 HNH endonuclease [Pseudomonas gingeri]NWE60385.1 HNH endonuclease [Pseudomonas gingeri]NWF05041.1 HNH endonuclease [Pseudomonas gingeri]